jgi:hypothetical protein
VPGLDGNQYSKVYYPNKKQSWHVKGEKDDRHQQSKTKNVGNPKLK